MREHLPAVEAAFASSPVLAQKVDFHLVQIDEAHASDKWPLKYTFETPSAKTMEEKYQYATALRDEFHWTRGITYVDGPWDLDRLDDAATNGSFQKTFTAWPELYVVFHNGVLTYVGQGSVETQGAYDINELLDHVLALCAQA